MIYFYPHPYLRDRQLDTIRHWPDKDVMNLAVLKGRMAAQADPHNARQTRMPVSWKRWLPLVNVKRRPADLPAEAVVYVWGALVFSGRFIVDLDTPWALVGYNLRAMSLYRRLLRSVLLNGRCLEIRCLSSACRQSVRLLFGDEVEKKAVVHYPKITGKLTASVTGDRQVCRFLFVATQFEIKGGGPLLRAFQRVYEQRKGQCRLQLVTHLPEKYRLMVRQCNGIEVFEAGFSRDEIYSRFMSRSDVLVLPTFVDSFGMVALEALAHGLALIATDLYALGEMVVDGENGCLLTPPVSIWEGVQPSKTYYNLRHIKQIIDSADMSWFEFRLATQMERFVTDPVWRQQAKQASRDVYIRRFIC